MYSEILPAPRDLTKMFSRRQDTGRQFLGTGLGKMEREGVLGKTQISKAERRAERRQRKRRALDANPRGIEGEKWASGSNRLEVRCTPRKGKGLFALQPIAKDTYIFDYDGELLTEAEYRERYANGEVQEYCAQISLNCYVDARDPDKSGLARYMNHSSRPNVRKLIHFHKQTRSIRCYALSDILVGEELVWDYGKGYWDARTDVPVE